MKNMHIKFTCWMTYNSELGPGNFSDQFFFELDENYNFITKKATNFDQKKSFTVTKVCEAILLAWKYVNDTQTEQKKCQKNFWINKSILHTFVTHF